MAALANETRKTGIEVVGDMPWGTHFCLFYETKEDLLGILVAYCKTGLEGGEFCFWVVADPLTIEEATDALQQAVPELNRYLANSSIEIVSARDWYLQGGTFDLQRVTAGWLEKVARASARGYAGVRVTGDTAWLQKNDWKHFCEYEESLNLAVANQRLAVLCTYPLAVCGAVEILDVVRTHQFALAKRHGEWDVIETAGLKQAKAEIKRLNEELEQRVEERTGQLVLASEALREAQTELAHVNRVTTMGQLAASIAHELNQPIAAAVTNAYAALRWLGKQPPDLAETRLALAQRGWQASRRGHPPNSRAHQKGAATKGWRGDQRSHSRGYCLDSWGTGEERHISGDGTRGEPAAHSGRSGSTATSHPQLDHERGRSDER